MLYLINHYGFSVIAATHLLTINCKDLYVVASPYMVDYQLQVAPLRFFWHFGLLGNSYPRTPYGCWWP